MFEYAVTQAVKFPPMDYIHDQCPDQYVGTLKELVENPKNFSCREHAESESTLLPEKRVILVLESPHQKEFISPFGPAKGSTGTLIRKYLREILPSGLSSCSGLFLVNAIQNQCSLGHPPEEYRDDIFLHVWHQYGRVDFVRRLNSLINSRDFFVINACTKGKSKGLKLPLRQLVEDAIIEVLDRKSDIRITHPASWASSNNRRATW